MTGIPTDCTRCAHPLVASKLTGVCRECKHIDRDARAGFTAAEVPLDAARANFTAALTGLYRPLDASAVYLRGACRACGRFAARKDTGKCEWCSGPRRFPAKRHRSKRAARVP